MYIVPAVSPVTVNGQTISSRNAKSSVKPLHLLRWHESKSVRSDFRPEGGPDGDRHMRGPAEIRAM